MAPGTVIAMQLKTEKPPEWTSRRVRAGGTELRVAERGERGTPLLLINGIGAHIGMWGPLERRLGDRRVIAFDLPGCGDSPRLERPVRMRGLAQLVSELIEQLEHPHVDVLGISFGGALAQELAYRHPDRVRRLILCATSAGLVCVPPRPLAGLFLLTPVRYYSESAFKFTMPRIVGGRTAREGDALHGQMHARLSRPPSTVGYLYQLYAASGWTSFHYLPRITQPTLVIAGEDDPAIPLPNGRLLAHRIPDARLHVVRDGGHAFLLDEPESVVGEIDAFLG
jgi:poly(3-hydroxyalkanoate) depolymerase